jgi:hypothetical protein
MWCNSMSLDWCNVILFQCFKTGVMWCGVIQCFKTGVMWCGVIQCL